MKHNSYFSLLLLILDLQSLHWLSIYLSFTGEGVYFDSFGLIETTDFLQPFNLATINTHKLPENTESVSKKIPNFKLAAHTAQQGT